MISPEQVRRTAARLYREYLEGWIEGKEFTFPKQLKGVNLSLRGLDHSEQIEAVQALVEGSKENLGYGYSVRREECNSPLRGKNREPREIYFETANDLLQLVGKKQEFGKTRRVAIRVRQQFPQLDDWLVENVRKLHSYHGALDGLLEVAQYFVDTPRPQLYIRQLPLSVDTKFIERNKGKLSSWLDRLIPESVDANETKFERRYGLREKAEHVKCRALDHALLPAFGFQYEEFSLPLHELQQLHLRDLTVLIVENEMNLLTLPPCRQILAMWGKGDWVARFSGLPWLHECRILYWGDVDVEGFEALASLRKYFGERVESLLMNEACVQSHGRFAVPGNEPRGEEPALLRTDELAAFRWCRDHQRRLEQERIPQPYVDQALRAWEARTATIPSAECISR